MKQASAEIHFTEPRPMIAAIDGGTAETIPPSRDRRERSSMVVLIAQES